LTRTSRRTQLALAPFALLASVLAAPQSGIAQTTPQATTAPISPSIAARTVGMDRRHGFISIYLDAQQSRILLEIPRDATRALLMICR
jgi:hypothetical protein